MLFSGMFIIDYTPTDREKDGIQCVATDRKASRSPSVGPPRLQKLKPHHPDNSWQRSCQTNQIILALSRAKTVNGLNKPSMTNFIQIDRVEMLKFFDYPEDTRHANAMVAMFGEELGAGLMKLYLERAEGAEVQVLPGPCNQGTQKGHRLDRWILAQWPERSTLFQVEIKNWSANSINSKKLALDASAESVAAHKRQRWSTIWYEGEQRLRELATGKSPDADEIVARREDRACALSVGRNAPNGGDRSVVQRVLACRKSLRALLGVFNVSLLADVDRTLLNA